MTAPILSRIVTCYKQWTCLEKWLVKDALMQAGVEWIIVNDAPDTPIPEKIQAIIKEKGIRLLQEDYNIGRCNARNRGAEEASGEWLDFVDGDDLPLCINLENFDQLDADLILCPVVGYRADTTYDPASPPAVDLPWSADTIFQKELFPNYYPVDYRPCGTLWRRSRFLAIGGFDARFDDAGEDGHIVWKAHRKLLVAARFELPKQLFFLDEYPGKPKRLSATSVYNLFRLYEQYGIKDYQHVFHESQAECLRRVRWQAWNILKSRNGLGFKYRLSEALKALFR